MIKKLASAACYNGQTILHKWMPHMSCGKGVLWETNGHCTWPNCIITIILFNGTIVLPTALLPQRYPRLAAGNLEANALLVDEVSSNGSIAVPTALSQLSRLCYRRTGGRGHEQRNSTRSPKQRGLFIQLPPPPSLPPPGARPGLRPRCQRGTALSILGSGGSLLH